MGFKILRAGWFDIPEIVNLASRFFAESNFSERLHEDKAKHTATLQEFIDNPYVASFIARGDDDELLGYIHIYCQNDYTEERIGEMYQMFIKPEARATGVSRGLVTAAVEQYKKWGCKRAYAEASPGFNDDGRNVKLFENLWRKQGYVPTGVIMMLEID
jgi:GNAT superfamily N-acetyltransferase